MTYWVALESTCLHWLRLLRVCKGTEALKGMTGRQKMQNRMGSSMSH
jgi:hypothetical protein